MGAACSGPQSQAGATTVAIPNGTSSHTTSESNNQQLCQAKVASDSDLDAEEAIQVLPAHTLPLLLAVKLPPLQPDASWQLFNSQLESLITNPRCRQLSLPPCSGSLQVVDVAVCDS